MPNRGLLAVSERYHLNAMKSLNFSKALDHYKNIERELKNRRLTPTQAIELKEAETIIRGAAIFGQNKDFQKLLLSSVRNKHAVQHTKSSIELVKNTLENKKKKYWVMTNSRKQKIANYESDINKLHNLQVSYMNNSKQTKIDVFKYFDKFEKHTGPIIPDDLILSLIREENTIARPSAPSQEQYPSRIPSAPIDENSIYASANAPAYEAGLYAEASAPAYDKGAPPSYEAAITGMASGEYVVPPAYTPYERLITDLSNSSRQVLNVNEQDIQTLQNLSNIDGLEKREQIAGLSLQREVVKPTKEEPIAGTSMQSQIKEESTTETIHKDKLQDKNKDNGAIESSKNNDSIKNLYKENISKVTYPDMSNLPDLEDNKLRFKSLTEKAKNETSKKSDKTNKIRKDRERQILAN